MAQEKEVHTIDLTPSWESLIPTLLALAQCGNATGRATAINELTRLARFADAEIVRRERERKKAKQSAEKRVCK